MCFLGKPTKSGKNNKKTNAGYMKNSLSLQMPNPCPQMIAELMQFGCHIPVRRKSNILCNILAKTETKALQEHESKRSHEAEQHVRLRWPCSAAKVFPTHQFTHVAKCTCPSKQPLQIMVGLGPAAWNHHRK